MPAALSAPQRGTGPCSSTQSTKKPSSEPRRSTGNSCATFYAIQGGNDLGWRVETPAKALDAKVCVMPEVGAARPIMLPNPDDEMPWYIRLHHPTGPVEIHDGVEWRENLHLVDDCDLAEFIYPEHEGAAIWTRPDLARATHAKAMREQGIRVIAEVDDNYLSDPKLNHFMRANGFDATARLDHMKSVASMDSIIVTTEWLRDEYHRSLKRELNHCPPIYVCGNHVDPTKWPERVERTGRLRVGYMGSDSHRWDIRMIFPTLKWCADNGCEVVIVGYDPQWRRFMDYTHVPWTTPAEYRQQGLPLDIALAPLLHNQHTLGKSDIKPLEYGMSGAACVASNMPVYNKTYRHEETVLFAQSREEFLHQTARLVTDWKLRDELAGNMQTYIREERDITKHTCEWMAAINGD